MSAGRSIVLAGASGLVGRESLNLLLAAGAWSTVTALVRRALPDRGHEPPLRVAVVDFEHLDGAGHLLAADQVLCALGTTIRTAGSQAAFRRVDFDYPLQLAELALSHGAGHFLLVSSAGANARSRVFYSRVKGELEEAILRLGYRSVTIVRPSFLLGAREEFRPGEAIMKRVGFLLPRAYRPVQARSVAAALVEAARADRPGTRILENPTLLAFPETP
jgi:uncharacterized protein YbjT (DUF2867 family)